MATTAYTDVGAVNATLYSRNASVLGLNIVEDAATPAAAEVLVRDGGATGDVVYHAKLAAEETVTVWLGPQGWRFNTDVFVERPSGTTRVTAYIQ